MPGLAFCGRRSTIVAGDDLEFKCIFTICLRIVEVILIIPSLVLTIDNYRDGKDCFHGLGRIGILPAAQYPTVSFLVALVSIVTDMAIFFLSGRGSPTEPQKRRPIGFLFAIQVVTVPLILLAVVVCGIVNYFDAIEVANCIGMAADDGWKGALIAAICFQAIECCIFMVYLVHIVSDELRRRGSRRTKQDGFFEDELDEGAEKWENCCRCCCRYTAMCCCFSFGGRGIQHEDFSAISEVLADLFQAWTLDLTPSDIKMGLRMLGLLQEERRQEKLKEMERELDLAHHCQIRGSYLMVNDALKTVITLVKSSDDAENGQGPASAGEAPDLCGAEQRSKRKQSILFKAVRELSGIHYEFSARSVLSPSCEDDRYRIAEGARFVKYSEAINTWKNYIFMYPLTGACEVSLAACSLTVGRHRNRTSAEPCDKLIIDDFSFPLHEAALLKVVGFDQSKVELAYAYFNKRTSVEGAVYCILVDHVWKSVVVCIRGSLSLADYVVNLDIAPESLDDIGEEFGFQGRGEYCHRGYMARAQWIYEDMKKHGILDSLISEERGKYKNYQLRITGHSLGAGTAAPLALLMRRDFPSLRCLCFGPPGGLFTLKTARKCEDFVTTFVVNSDLVPRISASTVRLLRDELLNLVARIKVPKREVLKMRLTDRRHEDLPEEGLAAFLHGEDEVPETDFSVELDKFKERLRACQDEDESSRTMSMWPPGKVIHLVKTSKRERYKEMLQGFSLLSYIFNLLTCNRFVPRDSFTPTWACVDDFNEVIVSKTIVSDHMVDYVRDALCSVAAQCNIDPSLPP